MAKQSWKGSVLVAPVPPALVTCGTMEKPNILTVAWTGVLSSHPPKTYISLRPERYSYPIIKESGLFVINLTTEALVRAADFCGVRSGREMDKFAAMGLHPEEVSPDFPCPMLKESPLSLCCRVEQVLELGSHDMFLAEILSVEVDESLLDETGRLALEKAHLAAYAHGQYFALGRTLGTFGYSVRKKKDTKRKK